MKKKNILITGASGFLGGAFYQHVKAKKPSGSIYAISRRLPPEKNFIQCDFFKKQKLRLLIQDIRPDLIFHFIGGRGRNLTELHRKNVLSTQNLFETLQSIPNYSPRVVIPGSAAEYGVPPAGIRKIHEKILPAPVASYGFSKLTQTHLAMMFARSGMDVTVARIFNVTGTGTPDWLAAGSFAKQITACRTGRDGEGVLDTMNLEGERDFLDIEDVCRALHTVSRKGRSGEVYNVCSGQSVRIRELLREMIHLSGRKIHIKENLSRISSSCSIVGSNQKLRALGWKPRVSLERSLARTLKFYQSISN